MRGPSGVSGGRLVGMAGLVVGLLVAMAALPAAGGPAVAPTRLPQAPATPEPGAYPVEPYPIVFGSADPTPVPVLRQDAAVLAIAADPQRLADYVDHDIMFRTSVRLRADRAYVEDLYRNPDRTTGRLGGGALLTPEESKELDVRGQLGLDAAAIDNALSESPTFAGVFVDHTTGTLVVAATDPNLVADLAVPLSHPERFEVRVVERSLADLTRMKEAILAQWISGVLPDISSLGIRTPENKVSVYMQADSPSGRQDIATVTTTIAARAEVPADALEVEFVYTFPSSLEVDPNAPAVVGGHSFAMSDVCSVAFEVTRGSTHYVLTAGHCSEEMTAGTVATHDGRRFGIKTNYWSRVDGGHADVGLIYLDSAASAMSMAAHDHGNLDYGVSSDLPVTAVADRHDMGDMVCHHGYRSDQEQCGEIINPSRDYGFTDHWGNQGTLHDMVEFRACGLGGDSGGAVTFRANEFQAFREANGVFHGFNSTINPEDPDIIPGCTYVDEGVTHYVLSSMYSKWGNLPDEWGVVLLDLGEGRPKSDFKGNYCPDVLGRRASNGRVYGRWGDCKGSVASTWTLVGATGTIGLLDIFSVGNWSIGSPTHYCTDLVGRTASGKLKVYHGNCPAGTGAVHAPTDGSEFNSGWGIFDLVFSPGDWTGEGCSDLMARTPAGDLFLYRGNCLGGLVPGSTPIGAGWNTMTSVFGPGDFSGDGCNDVVARTQGGTLLQYRGNCVGGWVTGAGEPFNAGWQSFTKVFSPGDISGDECPDILAVSGYNLRRYRGNCQGGLVSGYSLMTGNDWNAYNLLW